MANVINVSATGQEINITAVTITVDTPALQQALTNLIKEINANKWTISETRA